MTSRREWPFAFSAKLVLAILTLIPAASAALGEEEAMVSSGRGSVTFLDHLIFGDYRPRAQFTYQTGDGIGYVDQYFTAGGFVPLYQNPEHYLAFTDLRVLVEDGRIGCNLGIGNRLYVERINSTLGGYFYFDNRNTGRATFSQVSGGVDLLGDSYDARFNVYVPVDQDSKLVATPLTSAFFEGNQLFSYQQLVYETALTGFDSEVGSRLFSIGALDLWGFIGGYHYQGDNAKQAWGPRGRIELRTAGILNAQLAVANDRLFGTTVVFGVAANFPSSRPAHSNNLDLAIDRLADPVQRTWNVVVYESQVTTTTSLVDPSTNAPFVVYHVRPGANGTGTSEDPAGSLDGIVSSAGDYALIIVHNDDSSTPIVTNLHLKTGQRLLGSADNFVLATSKGNTTIAASTSERPVLTSSTGNVITLNNNTRVGGLNIVNAAGNAIAGNGISNYVVEYNTISGAGGNGINLVNTGSGLLAYNNITSSAREGIYAYNNNTPMLLSIYSNTIAENNTSGTGAGAISITDTTSAAPSTKSEVQLSANVISDNSGAGVAVNALGQSELATLFQENIIQENSGAGIAFTSKDQAKSSLIVDSTELVGNGTGINVNVSGTQDGLAQVQIASSLISQSDGNGIQVRLADTSRAQFIVNDSSVEYNGGNGIDVATQADSLLVAQVTSSTLTANRYGMYWSGTGTDSYTSSLSFTGNTVTNNSRSGLRTDLTNESLLQLTASSNTFTANADRGIHLFVNETGRINAQILSNQFASNGQEGVYLESISTNADNSITALVQSNSFSGSADSGVRARVDNEGRINLELISNTSSSGYMLDNDADVDENEEGRIRYSSQNNVGTISTSGDGDILSTSVGTFFGN